MHSTVFRRLRWVLAGAVVCFAAASSPVSVGDESPGGASAGASTSGATKNADGPILAPGKIDSPESAITRDAPTLAPPRRNALREPVKTAGSPAGKSSGPVAGSSPTAGTPSAPPGPSSSLPGPSRGPDAKPPAGADDKSLRPIPDGAGTAAEIEAASFNGITPGSSTIQDVEKAWGKPKEVKNQNETLAHLYKVEPFDHVEVIYFKDKVASIVIRLARAFPAEGVAHQLSLANLRPVLVSNDLGEILGQVYPERGVVFSFEPSTGPGKATMKVAQIILESITAEPFLLRAETNLDSQSEASLRDLEQALKLAPEKARAHWLMARLLVLVGDSAKAVAAADAAVRLEPKDAQFLLTRAQILGQAGRFTEALRDAEQAIALSGERLHVKARGQCLMGDLLGSGPQPDYKRAIDYHVQAIKTADALAGSPHPAVRLPAKEVLIDAHLGAAHDIAWGNWNQKQTAVMTWLKRASAFADELIKNDGGTNEHRFRVATRALAACVGAQGKIDPNEWTEQAVRVGEDLIKAAADAPQKQQIRWDLGMALYDAVQIHQMRNERDLALKHGQRAIEYLDAARPNKDTPADAYLLGRLYFRLGSIHSLGQQQNHKAAVTWFDKAVPALQKAVAQVAPFELGRLGETFVSMGVSYWEASQRQQAVKLTQQGVELMEKAVKDGQLPKTALDVPYANLATMHRHLNQDREAEKYLERSVRKPSPVRK